MDNKDEKSIAIFALIPIAIAVTFICIDFLMPWFSSLSMFIELIGTFAACAWLWECISFILKALANAIDT